MEKKKKRGIINWRKAMVIIAIILVIGAISFASYRNTRVFVFPGTYAEFLSDVEGNKVDFIRLTGNSARVDVFLENGDAYTFYSPRHEDFWKTIIDKEVEIRTRQISPTDAIMTIARTLPLVFIFVIMGFMIFYIVGSFTLQSGEIEVTRKVKATFDDVGGLSSVKKELQYIVKLLEGKAVPGIKLPRGILLEGEPGYGKTTLARAIAGEAGVPFIALSGNDFSSMFAGVGSAKIKKLYKLANEQSPVVIFIDEIDVIGVKRSSSDNSVSRDQNATLAALLTAMDGLMKKDRTVFIGATNRAEVLDKALLRPGRFEKQIHIGLPDTLEDIIEIVDIHLRDKKLADQTEKDLIYSIFVGHSGAMVEWVLNDATVCSVRDGNGGYISFDDIRKSLLRTITKSNNEDNHLSIDMQKRVAVHEVGHMMVGRGLGKKLLYASTEFYSAGIGGVTQFESTERGLYTPSDFEEQIAALMGGYIAEELIFFSRSTLSSNDLKHIDLLYKQMEEFKFVHDDSDLISEIEKAVRKFIEDNKTSLLYYSFQMEKGKVFYESDF